MAELDIWLEQNAVAVRTSKDAQKKFSEESFAMSTLCGAVLQVAAKAIELYSTNTLVPSNFQDVVGKNGKIIPFCIGKEVRGVPVGLIIYAGRNQHTHFNDPQLRSVSAEVFDRLALYLGAEVGKDLAFDLANPLFDSCAHNITAILGWRSYEAYVADMHGLLKIDGING